MSSTSWMNLQLGEGRRTALYNTLALLRWHIASSFLIEPSDRIGGNDDNIDGGNDNDVNDNESQYSDATNMDMDEQILESYLVYINYLVYFIPGA